MRRPSPVSISVERQYPKVLTPSLTAEMLLSNVASCREGMPRLESVKTEYDQPATRLNPLAGF